MVPNKFKYGTKISKMVPIKFNYGTEITKMVLEIPIMDLSFQKWYQINFIVYKIVSNQKIRLLKINSFFGII